MFSASKAFDSVNIFQSSPCACTHDCRPLFNWLFVCPQYPVQADGLLHNGRHDC